MSTTGVVTPVAAGHATIYADSGTRGTLLVRVFPRFGGVWTGDETFAACEGTGDFRDVCGEFTLGTVYYHYSTMTQNEASVSSVLDAGDGSTATLQGTVAVGGELALGPGLILPFDGRAEVQNWRSRADQPGRMTGSYRVAVTAPGLVGSFIFDMQLQDLRRTPSATQSTQGDGERRRTAAAAIAERLSRIRSGR